MSKVPPLLVITGPTATGKTEAGVLVAKAVGGEVVSADSMLVYRHMDVGTAKPTLDERDNIPHHMIDIIDPDEEYSVALFQEQARSVIKEVHARGNLPILVGGTGLYVRSVIDHYDFSGAGGDTELREKLQKEAEAGGAEALHRKLSSVDPDAAARLHPRDTRRVIRALEVYYRTGKPISSYQFRDRRQEPIYNLAMFGLTMPRETLYRRIETRVDRMIGDGLVDEVRALLAGGYSPDLPSMRGLGYKEMILYLSGEISLEGAVELLKMNTRRFAKRQLTWFRRDARIKWLDIEKYGSLEIIAQEITRIIEGVF
ncbi:MAG: tRNA (adenosine(37)-N6)-dimethylallyltransferase MiaA [Firmicutes bacterium]|nr:tRNA (adenosine(37)-N6)-dimethylallyltransferase MiaA [Bacillota bacterium]